MYKTNSRTQVQAANFVYVLKDVQCTCTGMPRGRHRGVHCTSLCTCHVRTYVYCMYAVMDMINQYNKLVINVLLDMAIE